MELPIIRVWTDGSIDKNPGNIGGWAYLLKLPNGEEVRDSGGYELEGVTNNHAEITAVIKGLAMAREFQMDCVVMVISDSQYVINQAERKWKRKKNIELLARLDKAIVDCGTSVEFAWVRGHNGVFENEVVDELAGLEVKMIQADIVARQYERRQAR